MDEKLRDNLIDYFTELDEFLDQYADADLKGTDYVPNKAMTLQCEGKSLLNELEKE